MIIRAIDQAGDWTLGAGKQSYKSGSDAIAQDIQTKLLSWLNDTFWAMDFGVDWRNLLGGAGQQTEANILIQARQMILKAQGVVRINSVQANLDSTRHLFVSWSVDTIYSRSVTGQTSPS